MYDPELALQTERDLAADQLLLASVKERCGEHHPWTQRVELVTDILNTISQKENDLANCFDPIREVEIESDISELVVIAREALYGNN